MELYKFKILLVSYIAISCIINSFSSIEARTKWSKSIKVKDGYIYDCVGIYKQPAFDHPLLKNHKIQMEPSFTYATNMEPFHTLKTNISYEKSINNYTNSEYPEGTVPIQRISKEEKRRSDLSFKQMFASSPTGFEFAGYSTKPYSYYEVGGAVSVYNPHAEAGQFSASVISVEAGPQEEFSTIRVGWMVNPNMFGDNQTHLYQIWGQGVNGVMHGCYFTQCPGFIVVSRKIPLNLKLNHISTPGGTQHYAKLAIAQDSQGNWWFRFTEDIYGNYIHVGYWPAKLFKHFQKGGEIARMGGMVYSDKPYSPPMGSGGKDCHFKQMTVGGPFHRMDDKSESRCYKVTGGGDTFWFGGPGGDYEHCH